MLYVLVGVMPKLAISKGNAISVVPGSQLEGKRWLRQAQGFGECERRPTRHVSDRQTGSPDRVSMEWPNDELFSFARKTDLWPNWVKSQLYSRSTIE